MFEYWFKALVLIEQNCWPLLYWLRLIIYKSPFRRIPLPKHKFAAVSVEDYERLNKFKWYVMRNATTFYVVRYARRAGSKKYSLVWMHREVLPSPKGLFVDHINHCGLDNRRSNLRLATRRQNMYNRRKLRTGLTSLFKGVYWRKDTKRWRANITVDGKKISLGQFLSEIDAAKAYDNAAKIYHKEFAQLNFSERSGDSRSEAKTQLRQSAIEPASKKTRTLGALYKYIRIYAYTYILSCL
jgi:hypothetical protein